MALRELSIRNFAIIKQLEIELENGLTVITGETGAGKSIVLGALNLVLGSRADANLIRHGEDQCEVSALFDISKLNNVSRWLEDRDLISADETQFCLVRRILKRDKPTKAYVNDQPTTLSTLKELGTLLVDLHGQHEHQSLLRSHTQRQIIDQFAKHGDQLKEVARLSATITRLERELKSVSDSNTDAQDRIDLLAFQLEELEAADLAQQPFSELENEHSRLANTEQLQIGIAKSLDTLFHDEQHNVSAKLGQQVAELEQLAEFDVSLAPVVEQLNNALSYLDESKSDLDHCLQRVEADPERLQEIDQRMALLMDLARKHRCTEAELEARFNQLSEEHKRLQSLLKAPETLNKQIASLREDYFKIATAISGKRKKTAELLSKKITAQMQDLGMAGGQLTISVASNPDSNATPEHGIDQIEFTVSTNQGMPLQPLNKTASGGELSRISLAIQVITSEQAQTPTLVFDEVDVGVGGKVADIVGERLQALGKHAQVLCITHLPQVASQGAHHFAVDKVSSNYETYSTLLQLDQDQRLEEIARMLGGKEVTDQTRAHAAEMLNRGSERLQEVS